jgi:hypothetical protein
VNNTLSAIAASVNETINFTASTTYTQNISGADAITLASGVNVDITGATLSATTSVSGSTGDEKLTIDQALSSINLGTGTGDTLITTATMNLSGKVSGIETLNVTGGTTTLNYTDIGSSGISTLSGSGSVSINGTTSMDIHSETVSLGTDNLSIAGTTGNDNLVLDFSQLDKVQFNGSSGNDMVSFFGSTASTTLTDTNAFTNIETLDIHSLGLSAGGLTIDANSLYAFTGTNVGHSLTLDAASADLSAGHLSLSGVNSWSIDGGAANSGNFTLSSGNHTYSLTDTSGHTTDLHVLAL